MPNPVLHTPILCLFYILQLRVLIFNLFPLVKYVVQENILNVPVTSTFIIMCMLDNLADSADCGGLLCLNR